MATEPTAKPDIKWLSPHEITPVPGVHNRMNSGWQFCCTALPAGYVVRRLNIIEILFLKYCAS
jgi:hypothetical protein